MVQAVLASRIDRLPEREKAVLQTAAVIGKEFAACVLRRVAELPEADLAAALQRARILIATGGRHAAPEIETALRDAMALVETTEARAYAPFIHVEGARLARTLGDEAAHQRELREAHQLFTEMGATARAEQVGRELRS